MRAFPSVGSTRAGAVSTQNQQVLFADSMVCGAIIRLFGHKKSEARWGGPPSLWFGDVRLELLEKRFPHRFCRASAL